MNNKQAIIYEQEIPDVLQAMSKVHKVVDSHEFDRGIYHQVLLRASQINRCGFCVKMHTEDAREYGISSEQLDQVVVWDQVDTFSDREKAALAWTEALTRLENKTDYASLRAKLRIQFTDKEISILTANIAMINLWNRIGVSKH